MVLIDERNCMKKIFTTILACCYLCVLVGVLGCGKGDKEKLSGEAPQAENMEGVQVYQLKSVRVSSSSVHTKNPKYANGHAPIFRVYIDKNGEEMGKIEAKNASWEIDFPTSEKNRWKIREGVEDTYLIRLRDKNTNLSEHPIMQVSDLKAEDFAKGEIFEKLDKLDNQSRAVRFVFEAVDE